MASDSVQFVRALLCSEPRGHADMYGGFVTEPDDDGADLGVLFWHKDGFSTACGHGTIALGVWAVETGLVPTQQGGIRDVRIDVPSGRVTARVAFDGGEITSVSFVNVPSWVHATGVEADVEGGPVACDIAFGGAMYAVVPAASVGLRVHPDDLPDLIRMGRRIRNALNAVGAAQHPSDPRLSGVYGTIFTEDVDPRGCRGGRSGGRARQRGRAAPAQRHDLRRRGGGPVTLRLRHGGPGGSSRGAGPARAGGAVRPRLHRRQPFSRPGREPGRGRGCRRSQTPSWSRSPAPPTGSAAATSPSTRVTFWCPVSS